MILQALEASICESRLPPRVHLSHDRATHRGRAASRVRRVVGASATPGSIGDVLCRNLREGGFRGPVFYVNPRHESIAGEPSYPDVRSLPQAVDVAIIATPPPTLPAILEHCGVRGVRGALPCTTSASP